jgi:hypothetical protein
MFLLHWLVVMAIYRGRYHELGEMTGPLIAYLSTIGPSSPSLADIILAEKDASCATFQARDFHESSEYDKMVNTIINCRDSGLRAG